MWRVPGVLECEHGEGQAERGERVAWARRVEGIDEDGCERPDAERLVALVASAGDQRRQRGGEQGSGGGEQDRPVDRVAGVAAEVGLNPCDLPGRVETGQEGV